MKTSLAVIAAAALALSACSSSDSGPTSSTSSSATKAAKADTGTDATEGATAKKAAVDGPEMKGNVDTGEDGLAYWGQTYAWGDGLALKIDPAGTSNGNQRFKFTFTNGTKAPYDISTPGIVAQVGDVEAEEVGEGNPGTVLRPGKSTTYTTAYKGKGDVIVWVQPSFEVEAVYFMDEL